MRFLWVVAAAAFACGGTSSSGTGTGTGSTGTGSPDAGGNAQTFALTLNISGSGAVTAPAQTCAVQCVLQVPAGALQLVAVPGSGWHFTSWSGLCSNAACDLTVSGDLTLTANFDQDTAVAPPVAVKRNLTMTVNGPGRLVSSPIGIDCPGTCSATFDDGTNVLFTATPNTGAKFDGFSGACAGSSCTVTLGTDAAVGGTFEALIPVQHVLTVSLTGGTGTVTSTPAGIDCPGVCATKFDEGTKVNLTPLNGSGMNFGGFSEACAGNSCTVTMTGDVTVGVAFVPKPDPCLGLMPAIPQSMSVAVAQNDSTSSLTCATGTSDGLGNFALLSTQTDPGQFGASQFVGMYTPGDFGPELFNSFSSGGAQQLDLLGHPSGFGVVFSNQPFSSFTVLYELGINSFESVTLDDGQGGGFEPLAVAEDPAGGTAVVRNYPLTGANWVTTWQEYDPKSTPTGLELQIGSGEGAIEAVHFLPSGDALVIEQLAVSTVRMAIWVNHGQLLSSWFKVSDEKTSMSALSGNSMLLRGDDGSPLGVVADSIAQVSPVPGWIAARPAAGGPFLFHSDGAYAMFATPHCPQMEVLTTSGISCGCASVPGASKISDVGREGTIIAPSGAASGGTCSFTVYPHTLR
jgi:hypothetical protein